MESRENLYDKPRTDNLSKISERMFDSSEEDLREKLRKMREEIEGFKSISQNRINRLKLLSNDAKLKVDDAAIRSGSKLHPEDNYQSPDFGSPSKSQKGPVYDDIRKLADHVYHGKPGIPSYHPRFDHAS